MDTYSYRNLFFYRQLHTEMYLMCLVTLREQFKRVLIRLDEINKWIILILYFQLMWHYAEKIVPLAVFGEFWHHSSSN